MVARHSELPPKYLFLFGVFMFIPVLVMVILISVFSGGKARGIPYEFAVDNEQRIYMSFNSGLYVVENGQFTFLLPGDKGSYALSVSDDDMLTIADPLDIRIVDLTKSDLASGHLEVVQKPARRATRSIMSGLKVGKPTRRTARPTVSKADSTILKSTVKKAGSPNCSTLCRARIGHGRSRQGLALYSGFHMYSARFFSGASTPSATQNTLKKRLISGRSAQNKSIHTYSPAENAGDFFAQKIPLVFLIVRAIIEL